VPSLNTPIKILREFFRYEDFRASQQEIIDAVLNYNHVLAVLPTGAGKSICYQIPALMMENFSIVISPLIALMKDQVDGLNKKKEVAAFINSTMSYQETEAVLRKISLGSIKILYLAPERIDSLKFADRLKELNPSNLFVDEAHCISEWGHSFRPSYLKIKEFINHIRIKKVSAFTATATPEVREDILFQLGLENTKIFVRGFERENLNLKVLHIKKKKEKCLELLQEIKGPAIIYSASRKKAEEVAEYLNLNGITCSYYHAGMTSPERRMGIDKADIRTVIHFNTPGSIESYYQEIGRAGRDEKESFCFLLHHSSDIVIQNFFITNTHPNKELIQNIYKAVCDHNRISVGRTSEKELVVDKEYISKYIGKEISSSLLHSALKYLENSGYIRLVSEYEKLDSIEFLFGKEKLYEFVQKTTYRELADVVVLILREFGSNVLSKAMKISTHQLAKKLLIAEKSIIESLNTLNNIGIISFQQAIDKDTCVLTSPRVNAENLKLNYKLINESFLNAQRKLDLMTDFVFTPECRFKNILKYFGEEAEDYRCGKCDNCTSLGKLKDSTTAYLSEIITETIEEANGEIPENFLINLLRGEKVKESAALFKHFGECKNFSISEIKGVIAYQISKGKIDKTVGRTNYLRIAKSKSPVSASPLTVDKKEHKKESYDDELYLFNLLREARKIAADRFMQSAYLICPDAVLREVARFKPTSKLAMMSIKGFNSRMFNKVGNDFLEIINSLEPKESKSKTQIKERELPQNIVETKKLLDKKYTLKEIAETRKLSEAVISMQIETIVEYESATDTSSLIKKENLEKILSEASKGFDNLKELKERLPSDISYPEIRIAVAKLRAASQFPSLNAQRKQ
jgi:ATP-dependent DNA helicase RecQ